MKEIVTVNTELPTVDDMIDYFSQDSLLDYDIIVFDPKIPYLERIEFSGGGSCISIESNKRLQSAMKHWSDELANAFKSGKTIYILLNEHQIDSGAVGYDSPRKDTRNYRTTQIDNYSILPVNVSLRNAKGRKLLVSDARFSGLYEAIRDIVEYRVVLDTSISAAIFTTRDRSKVVSGIVTAQDVPGTIVLLPYFDLSEMYEHNFESKEHEWTEDALRISNQVVGQIVAIDKILHERTNITPPPEWLSATQAPKCVSTSNETIARIETKISALEKQKELEIVRKNSVLDLRRLLYENGTALERAIEESLTLLGYSVENYRKDHVEIDHIIFSPEGLRMIGESEGKDRSAIDISKFRQLETNIQEDFARDDVNTPAKGVLFGNGFRFSAPDQRDEQFTKKCLTNAKRLGTALVRTSDLYTVIVQILDNPDDENYKASCRRALEATAGEIVSFPLPKRRPHRGKKEP